MNFEAVIAKNNNRVMIITNTEARMAEEILRRYEQLFQIFGKARLVHVYETAPHITWGQEFTTTNGTITINFYSDSMERACIFMGIMNELLKSKFSLSIPSPFYED